METTRPASPRAQGPRQFREQTADVTNPESRSVLRSDLPLEINMTDEPGGDPYNHTGNFKRLYR